MARVGVQDLALRREVATGTPLDSSLVFQLGQEKA
jgi:hypothetical protein